MSEKTESEKAEKEKKEYKGTVYAEDREPGEKQPKLGTVRLTKEKGSKIAGYAVSVRNLRGFSDLVRAHFETLAKDFTDTFRFHSKETIEIFGDLQEVDGEIRIKFDKYSDDELLDGKAVFDYVLEQFNEEIKRRGLKEDEEAEDDDHA